MEADYIRQYDEMPRSVCERLLTEFARHEDEHQLQEMADVRQFHDWNLNGAATTSGPLKGLRNEVVEIVSRVIDRYREDVCVGPYDWPDAYRLERMRVKRYHRGQGFFDDHVDVRNRGSACRFLAILFYLNDVKAGGRTTFRRQSLNIRPIAGRAVVFPPTWMFPHRGEVPTSADKYILGTYLQYR